MNKKWAVKRITINLTVSEALKLKEYCENTGRPSTDVIRELIRTLPEASQNSVSVPKQSEIMNAEVGVGGTAILLT